MLASVSRAAVLCCPVLCAQPSNIILSLEGGQAVLKVRHLTSFHPVYAHLVDIYPKAFAELNASIIPSHRFYAILSLIKDCGAVQVADFSSAVDPEGVRNGLYGIFGPTQHEETLEYAPPEVRSTHHGS